MTKTCPDCHQRRVLGKCKFGGPNVIINPHCRSCCAAPERDGWKPLPKGTTGRQLAARKA